MTAIKSILVATIFLAWSCQGDEYKTEKLTEIKPIELSKEQQDKLVEKTRSQLNKIYELTTQKDKSVHLSYTVSLMKYYNSLPLEVISKSGEEILKAVEQNGPVPYLGFLIDYLYRLNKYPTDSSIKLYHRFIESSKNWDWKKMLNTYLIVREETENTYIAYSENVGKAILRLMLSTLGKRQIAYGFRPNHFVRFISLIDNCNTENEQEANANSFLGMLAINRQSGNVMGPCNQLLEQVLTDLGSGGEEIIDQAIADINDNGFIAGAGECFEYLMDDQANQFVDELDELMSCYENQSGIVRIDTDIENLLFDLRMNIVDPRLMLATGYGWKSQENPDGTNNVTWSKYDNGKQTTHAIEWAGGTKHKTITWSNHKKGTSANVKWIEVNGEWVKKSKTTCNKNGCKTVRYDEQGNEVETEEEDDKDAEDAENADDVEDTEDVEDIEDVEDADVDDNVARTDDYVTDPCAELRWGKIREELTTKITKLQTQIIPNIDSPITNLDNPCFNQFAENEGPSKCLSVALCLEGYEIDENCQCVRKRSAELPDKSTGDYCFTMNCGEGYECDPATGTCKPYGAVENPNYSPGIVNPPVNIEIEIIGDLMDALVIQ